MPYCKRVVYFIRNLDIKHTLTHSLKDYYAEVMMYMHMVSKQCI